MAYYCFIDDDESWAIATNYSKLNCWIYAWPECITNYNTVYSNFCFVANFTVMWFMAIMFEYRWWIKNDFLKLRSPNDLFYD